MTTTIEVPEYLAPAVVRLMTILRQKGADYGAVDDPWTNFRATSAFMRCPPWECADFNEVQKLSRVATLRGKNGEPDNEALVDTYLDKAAYALLAFAMYLEYLGIPTAISTDTSRSVPGQHSYNGENSARTDDLPTQLMNPSG